MQLDAERYSLLLDALGEGVCTVDREWRITSFNRAAQEITGTPRERALTLYFGDLFQCELCACATLLSRVMASGEAIRDVATRLLDSSGHEVPVTLNATPFRDRAGEIVGLVAIFRDNRHIEALRRELRQGFTVGDIVSRSASMRRIFQILPALAESDTTTLILGESGTGKELLANAIHEASARHNKPFVAVNCGALPDNLLESELFGYKKGAFTDARIDKPGRFALANGGTLFLDEIGDTSMAMQIKLLRVLEEQSYEPLGATQSERCDVRVIAATNKDLAREVEQQRFRADLYYRINVITLELPSLAQRQEDIPLLVDHFLDQLNAERDRQVKAISRDALAVLLRYEFPGNIRELRNIIEHAHVLCPGEVIQVQCLPPHLLKSAVPPTSAPTKRGAQEPTVGVNLRSLSATDERDLIERTLDECRGRRAETAKRLGINPATLWRKMKKYGLLGR